MIGEGSMACRVMMGAADFISARLPALSAPAIFTRRLRCSMPPESGEPRRQYARAYELADDSAPRLEATSGQECRFSYDEAHERLMPRLLTLI